MLGIRFRLSLLVRMAVACAILGSLFLATATVFALFGGLVGLWLWEWLLAGFVVLSTPPGVSDVAAISPAVVSVAAFTGLLAVYYGWPYVKTQTTATTLFRPDPISLTTTAFTLVCLYLVVVDGSTAAAAFLERLFETGRGMLFVLTVTGLLTVVLVVLEIRREIRGLRETLIEESDPAAEVDPELEATARRLAQLADVPAPEVYVTESDRPESFALGTGSSAVIVVSTGLLERLSTDHTAAVLAHEVSHLANWDSRLLSAALVPVLLATDLIDSNPNDPVDVFLNACVRALQRYGQFAVAIISRGREWHADAGAVALTDSPAALAAALEELDETRRTPTEDLREWEATIVALDILPPETEDRVSGPFRTHPSTERRIDWLRRLAANS